MNRLEVIVGPMFSGKTEELLRRLRREEIAGKKTILFKPRLDDRYSHTSVKSHNGAELPCFSVENAFKINELLTNSYKDYSVIGIDEGQFFDDFLVLFINNLLHYNKKFIVSGLEKDFAMQNFGPMPDLMVLADKLDKMLAVCNKCGADDASFTQRLVNGMPATLDGPTILVGGSESYQARCRDCFEIG